MILSTIFEIALVGFATWAVLNENKFIKFEENIKRKFKKGE